MTSNSGLQGRVALVTGASSGIGRAAAKALAANGARVAINFHRNEAGAEATRKEIIADGSSAIAIQADVKQASSVESLVARTVAELGPIDILVNNAGSLIERLRILELTEERWDEVIDLNLKSAFLACQAVAGSMMKRKTGTMVNVSSIAGRTGGALGSIHYSTAKGGLITFTKGLAKELGPFGVRVNAVSPGVIDTPYHEQFSSPEMMKTYTSQIPLGRIGTPEEVASLVSFVCSPLSAAINGAALRADGGVVRSII